MTIQRLLYYVCNPVPINQATFLYSCAVLTIVGLCMFCINYRKIAWRYKALIFFLFYTWGSLIYYGYNCRMPGVDTFEIVYAYNKPCSTDGANRTTSEESKIWKAEGDRVTSLNEYAKNDTNLIAVQTSLWSIILVTTLYRFAKWVKQ